MAMSDDFGDGDGDGFKFNSREDKFDLTCCTAGKFGIVSVLITARCRQDFKSTATKIGVGGNYLFRFNAAKIGVESMVI